MIELACAETPADAARGLATGGAAWDVAIELGIDVTLLMRNLSLSPFERLRQAAQHLRFVEAVRRRTVPNDVRERMEFERLWEKIDALGGADPAWPEALRNGR